MAQQETKDINTILSDPNLHIKKKFETLREQENRPQEDASVQKTAEQIWKTNVAFSQRFPRQNIGWHELKFLPNGKVEGGATRAMLQKQLVFGITEMLTNAIKFKEIVQKTQQKNNNFINALSANAQAEIPPNFRRAMEFLEGPMQFKTETLQRAMKVCVHIADTDSYGSGCYIGKRYILSCDHCVWSRRKDGSDDAEESQRTEFPHQEVLFITSQGTFLRANNVETNEEYDVSILKINEHDKTALQELEGGLAETKTETVPIATAREGKKKTPLFCIGNPADFDLESVGEQTPTDFWPFTISTGYAKGYDAIRKPGLGLLKHTCWTYWGHSGAPLFKYADNPLGFEIIGVHTSWDENNNAMRHGAAADEILSLVKKYIFKDAAATPVAAAAATPVAVPVQHARTMGVEARPSAVVPARERRSTLEKARTRGDDKHDKARKKVTNDPTSSKQLCMKTKADPTSYKKMQELCMETKAKRKHKVACNSKKTVLKTLSGRLCDFLDL